MYSPILIALLVGVAVAAPGWSWGRRMGYRPDRWTEGRPERYGPDRWGPDRWDRTERVGTWDQRRPSTWQEDEETTEMEWERDWKTTRPGWTPAWTKVYKFQISQETRGAYTYYDEDGSMQGFLIDLMHAVCDRAGKECYAVMDKADNCWYFEEGYGYPGKGLMAGWYTGCLGMFPTTERKNSFDFSKEFTENPKVAMYYNPDAKIFKPENNRDLGNRTIGFVETWAMDPTCLKYQTDFQGNQYGDYTPVWYKDYETMVKAVLTKKVDAVLAPKALDLDRKGLAYIEPFFTCSSQGASVMTRKGDDVLTWWDKAFDEMKEDGEYRRICTIAERKHGDEVHCL